MYSSTIFQTFIDEIILIREQKRVSSQCHSTNTNAAVKKKTSKFVRDRAITTADSVAVSTLIHHKQSQLARRHTQSAVDSNNRI